MAEQLCFQKGFRIGITVDRYERHVGTAAAGMDILCGHILAGTGFTDKEDVYIGSCHTFTVFQCPPVGRGFCVEKKLFFHIVFVHKRVSCS